MTNYLDQIEIASPCTALWESMTGNETKRHCSLCNLDVYNISTMNKNEAEEFLAMSLPQGRVCARLYRRSDGTILTDNCPRGLRAIRNTAVYAWTKVAAIIAVLISHIPSYAQSLKEEGQSKLPTAQILNKDKPPVRGYMPQPMGGLRIKPDLSLYTSEVKQKIKSVWTAPPNGQGLAVVKVIFNVDSAGNLSDLQIEDSSGSKLIDQKALQAVKNAAPFKPLPYGAPKNIYIELAFDADKIDPKTNAYKIDNHSDLDFGLYMADLQRHIKRAWFPPKGYEIKAVTVIFKIHKQGSMSDLRLEHSSGVSAIDQAALEAIKNSHFRPLPAGAPESIEITFTFDHNTFHGAGTISLPKK